MEFFHSPNHSIALDRRTATGRAASEGRTIQVLDAMNDPEYSYGGQSLENYRTIIGVPLMRDGQAIGVFTLWRHHVEAFSPRQIALVETFADQAVIAIENVRLFNETKEALEQQTATAEVLEVISASVADTAAGIRQDPAELQEAVRQLRARHRTRHAGGPCHAGRPPRLGARDSAGNLR